LPAEVSSLVGRGPEIAAVLERLRTARVVTLTGPGGCGKTRLALRVAALAEAGFDDGAWLVELAPLTDPALVPASVAQALDVSERDVPTPAAGLVHALAGRELLVVLDNCEHVLEAAAGLVATLVARCPRVRPDKTAFARPCRGRSAGRNPRRDGSWAPGSPVGGSPPAGIAKQASS
jgi:non-specific serine/threonine protein kinase